MSDLVGKTFTVFRKGRPLPMKVERVNGSIAYCKSLDLMWELRMLSSSVRKIIELEKTQREKG